MSAWTHVGWLWIYLKILGVDGLIEIVEEQRCHNFEFRLTCRELDSHIAVLEAWYTSIDDYQNTTRPPENLKLQENDSELNQVYVYSSPKHDGVYETTNHSIDVATRSYEVVVNESFVNKTEGWVEGCGVGTFLKSYASWHEGDKRRGAVERKSSINLRAPISYRCTGVNHCSFILHKDYPPAVSWAAGVVFIKYACFDDSLSLHYCNREVLIAASGPDSEGYIHTPGYPNFYVGEECRWRLRVNPEQKVKVTLLDVSLRSIGPFEDHCLDFVSVLDSNGDPLLSSCEQVELPLRLTSGTDSVDIDVEAKSKGAFPKRGVLLHYKSVGCVTVAEPSDGYLVYRNENVAHYMCNVNYVFADTRQRARLIWCFDENRWNDTVPSCIIENSVPSGGGNDSAPGTNKDSKLAEANMIVDIVIPSLLIAALFIGNAFVVLIIYKYRKRKTDDLEDEFNTIPLSVNGTCHSAPCNAV